MTLSIVQLWLTENIPIDHLVCDGSAISRTTYAELFSVLGVMYGNGDGSTTFNLPDCRGYFPRCYAGVSTVDPDAATRSVRADGVGANAVGTRQSFSNKYHTHNHTMAGSGSGGPNFNGTNSGNTVGYMPYTSFDGGSEARPKNIYVIPIIGF